MIVNVRMKDGRTTFQFASRNDFKRTIGSNPTETMDQQPTRCWVKHNVEDPYWAPAKVPYIASGSIAFVVDARTMEDFGIPADEEAQKRKERYMERQQAEEKPDAD